ncbi:TerB family tellurite resistance protein [Pedobacter aquatilis]|uniref:TerB family tellurite resistance protein n=1 Tax=Pedobacter aquatilis TaxID=351343 RepID=UPI00292F3EE9|nr:TerB family tellurite resistance protein [Pedobacter aquatilis]
MKNLFLIRALWLSFLLNSLFLGNATAQSAEAEQLLLNVEKLSQLKNILSDMKKGYAIISTGYSAVKNISEGNFSLHEVFIDGLSIVSPELKKYRRIGEIISMQGNLVSAYRAAFARFSSSDLFSENELDYFSNVYGQLFSASLQNLDELLMVITSSQLRMNDEQRLRAIDRIFESVQDKVLFLKDFNEQASLLKMQRTREKASVNMLKSIYANP